MTNEQIEKNVNQLNFDDRTFWLGIRQALLAIIDIIERKIGISPTTSEVRKFHKKRT